MAGGNFLEELYSQHFGKKQGRDSVLQPGVSDQESQPPTDTTTGIEQVPPPSTALSAAPSAAPSPAQYPSFEQSPEFSRYQELKKKQMESQVTPEDRQRLASQRSLGSALQGLVGAIGAASGGNVAPSIQGLERSKSEAEKALAEKGAESEAFGQQAQAARQEYATRMGDLSAQQKFGLEAQRGAQEQGKYQAEFGMATPALIELARKRGVQVPEGASTKEVMNLITNTPNAESMKETKLSPDMRHEITTEYRLNPDGSKGDVIQTYSEPSKFSQQSALKSQEIKGRIQESQAKPFKPEKTSDVVISVIGPDGAPRQQAATRYNDGSVTYINDNGEEVREQHPKVLNRGQITQGNKVAQKADDASDKAIDSAAAALNLAGRVQTWAAKTPASARWLGTKTGGFIQKTLDSEGADIGADAELDHQKTKKELTGVAAGEKEAKDLKIATISKNDMANPKFMVEKLKHNAARSYASSAASQIDGAADRARQQGHEKEARILGGMRDQLIQGFPQYTQNDPNSDAILEFYKNLANSKNVFGENLVYTPPKKEGGSEKTPAGTTSPAQVSSPSMPEFASQQEASDAVHNGQLSPGTKIKIGGKVYTVPGE